MQKRTRLALPLRREINCSLGPTHGFETWVIFYATAQHQLIFPHMTNNTAESSGPPQKKLHIGRLLLYKKARRAPCTDIAERISVTEDFQGGHVVPSLNIVHSCFRRNCGSLFTDMFTISWSEQERGSITI